MKTFFLCLIVGCIAGSNCARAAGFATVAPMNTARSGQTTTLLPNGKILVAGGSGDTSAELYNPVSGTWSATGPLSSARSYHTATLLSNGMVLVAGGSGDTSAELYDPTSGMWSATGPLVNVRTNHTATLLSNGMVLVAGGKFYVGLSRRGPVYTYYASAELYNPELGTWSATGPLSIARVNQTSTLLPNGMVLVAGGSGDTSAELYDPTSGMWSATGPLSTARYTHTATLLPNGMVLVAGGSGDTSAELYDPTGGMWSATGPLSTAREYNTATLLPNGMVLVAGGSGDTGAELYDPTSGMWSATGPLSTARYNHTATLLRNGMVVVAGGSGNTSAELYNPANGTWSATGNLATARDSHTATLLPNGMVLVVGGSDAPVGSFASAELYNPATGTWSATGALTTARKYHTATLLPNGMVLVAGGYGSGFTTLASTELYNPGTGTWSATGNLSTARYQHTATLLPNGMVLLAGGYNGSVLTSAELYNPATGTCSATGYLTTARSEHTATLLPNGMVLVGGGFSGTILHPLTGRPDPIQLASAELYNPATGTWSATGNLAISRANHTATLLPSGTVLVAAGDGNGYVPLATTELYNLTTGTWSTTGNLTYMRANQTATLLPNGMVLVAGGEGSGSTELYNPASGTWSATDNFANARSYHTATLLLNGLVLVTGGDDGSGNSIANTELYDVGLGFSSAWQPGITVAKNLSVGHALSLIGTQFTGYQNESASGGGTNDSASNIPVVLLQNLVNEQQLFLQPDPANPWSATSYVSHPVTGFPTGYAGVTVFVNGTPSASVIIQVIQITVSPTSATLPNAKVGIAYASLQFAASSSNNSTYPYAFSAPSNALPAGMSLSLDGLLTGTPTEGGIFSFTVTAATTDGSSLIGSQNYSLTVTPPIITFAPLNLANGQVGVPYNQLLTASGGTAPYTTFVVSAGALPDGVSLSSSGLLSGTPTAAITANFIISALDSSTIKDSNTIGYTGTYSYTLAVTTAGGGTPPSIVPHSYSVNENSVLTVIAPGVLQDSVDQNNLPRTASILGAFPPHGNLVLSADGSFTYTPNANYIGTDTFKYQATNSNMLVSTPQTVTITVNFVNQPPSFNLPANPDKTVRGDDGAQTITGFASAISPGAPNESNQILTFSVTTNNDSIFLAKPAISATGTLTFTPNPNASGMARVSVSLADDGMTPLGQPGSPVSYTAPAFNITVNSAPPVLPGNLTASGMVQSPFRFKLSASGGAPISYSTTTLPVGLTLTADTISGLPTNAGSAPLTVTAVNSAFPQGDTKPLALVIVQELIISTAAGTGTAGTSPDGSTATTALLNAPSGVAQDASGNIYIADTSNGLIRKVDTNGKISSIASGLIKPSAVAVDSIGTNIFICEQGANRIAIVDSTKTLSTYYSGTLNNPTGIALDAQGNLYIADSGNKCVRKIGTDKSMSVVAGLGNTIGAAADNGLATAAQLNIPYGVAVDALGNIYIADSGDNVVRMVDTLGKIHTVAGQFGSTGGFSGDGGPATSAQLFSPRAVAVDAAGNIYIADSSNRLVREIQAADGIMVSLSGRGTDGDGKASFGAFLNTPAGISAGSAIFVADAGANRIRRLSVPVKMVASSPPAATPNPVQVGQSAAMTWSAIGSTPVTYKWDFGDGNTDTSGASSVSHSYATAQGSPYTVAVTAMDQTGQTLTASVQVVVKLSLIVPDELITEIETVYPADFTTLFPVDPNETIQSAPNNTIKTLAFNFTKPGKDSLNVVLNITLTESIVFTNANCKRLAIDVGGIIKVFNLNVASKRPTGTSAQGNKSDTIKIQTLGGQKLVLTASFKNGSFPKILQAVGLKMDAKGSNVAIPLTVLYGGHVYGNTPNVLYSAKKGIGKGKG